jgi:hypothetical protein
MWEQALTILNFGSLGFVGQGADKNLWELTWMNLAAVFSVALAFPLRRLRFKKVVSPAVISAWRTPAVPAFQNAFALSAKSE